MRVHTIVTGSAAMEEILDRMAACIVSKIMYNNGIVEYQPVIYDEDIIINIYGKKYIIPISKIIDKGKVVDFMNDIASNDTYVTDIICHAKIKEKDENKRP